ncbi:uncharacterized protein LOC119604125 [Lucilia sericata]|uniref:uncharacterized protein LOC119604125 n=1 Tax=Lucilia sericata TaxID=13632 RepID=UPI0018A7FCDC|nr:uncharacterized protein LOC119604125 [Lucilia sericata]
MCDVETITKDIKNILCHYKENQNRILLNACNEIRLCHGGYLDLTVRHKMLRRLTYFSTFILAIFTLIFATCGLWLLRRYNYSYNLGGCSSVTFLWPFEECPVVF